MPTKTVRFFGNRTLDARPDRLDLRDREYVARVVTLPPTSPTDADIRKWLPAYAKAGLVLDQKSEGSCTGFGLACVIHYLLWRRQMLLGGRKRLDKVSTRMLYHLARFYDEWPGEDYSGSSCRGALKAWHRHGVCTDRIWPYLDTSGRNVFVPPAKEWQVDAMRRRLGVYYRLNRASVVDIQAAILEVGAVYASADVHDGWDLPARRGPITGHGSLPSIRPLTKSDSLGGHAFALIGYNPTGFVVQNSWGPRWGRQGFAVLPYDEWVRRGSDAWVCAMGVPGRARDNSVVMLGARAGAPAGQSRTTHGQTQTPRPAVSAPVAPWDLEEATFHSVVMGNEGRPLNRIVTHENGAESVRQIVTMMPRDWLTRQPGGKRVVVYAHGGLNSEAEALNRVRVLAPYFKANGIYPLFLIWKTGPLETLSNILADQLALVPRPEGETRFFDRWAEQLRDAADRTVELVAGPAVKPVWTQMKQNAEASAAAGRSTELVVAHLAELAAAIRGLEIHLVGHSAGAILLGHLLDAAVKRRISIRSCSLYAPACTVAFANDHYGPAAEAGVLAKQDLHVHLLSDEREREDTVGPYRKSLLYLVSRALEHAHKTPLLGLADVFDPRVALSADRWNDEAPARDAIRRWLDWWKGQQRNLHVITDRYLSTGIKGGAIRASHGCFDNDVSTISATLTRILGTAPRHPIESLDY